MRADAEDGFIQLGLGTIQPHLHLFASFRALCATRHQDQSIRTDERGDDTRPTRKRRGQQLLSHAPHRHTDKIVIATGGGDLARQLGGFGWQFFRAATQPLGNEWFGEDVDGQRGRDGVAGDANYWDSGFGIRELCIGS